MPKKINNDISKKRDINHIFQSAMIMAENGRPTLALDLLEGLKSLNIPIPAKKLNDVELYICQYLNAGGASSQISQ